MATVIAALKDDLDGCRERIEAALPTAQITVRRGIHWIIVMHDRLSVEELKESVSQSCGTHAVSVFEDLPFYAASRKEDFDAD